MPSTNLSFSLSLERHFSILYRALEELNTPLSLGVYLVLRDGTQDDKKGLLSLKFTKDFADRYNDYASASRDFSTLELFRKSIWIVDVGREERRDRCMEKTMQTEALNSSSNKRLDMLRYDRASGEWRTILSVARKVRTIMGPFSLERVFRNCGWGSGSDASNRRPFTLPYHKYSFNSCTRECLPVLTVYLQVHNHLLGRWLAQCEEFEAFTPLIDTLPGDRYSTVLKEALVDRPICIAPGFNVFFQKGVDAHLKNRLRLFGCDLGSQERNKSLALKASRDDSLCTMDLSSASDLQCRTLMQILLSRAWYNYLDMIRTRSTDYGRGYYEPTERFSAMGNGFTFSLMTVVILSVLMTIVPEQEQDSISVYGDDLIFPKAYRPRVEEVLRLLGYVVNDKKTFSEGYFRESCGMDAWNGVQFPVYRWTEKVENLIDAYGVVNGLRLIGLQKTANYALSFIPKHLRFYGPHSLANAVLHNSCMSSWSFRMVGETDSWFFKQAEVKHITFSYKRREVRWMEPAILNSFHSSEGTKGVFLFLGKKTELKIGVARVVVSDDFPLVVR